jgi:hypothetical protein
MFEIIKDAVVGLGLSLKIWLFRGIEQLCDLIIVFLLGIKIRVKPDSK